MPSDIKISVVRPDIIPEIWDIVEPILNPAFEDDFLMDSKSAFAGLIEDRFLLFIVTISGKISGACILAIEDNKDSICHIISLGGEDFKSWKDQMNLAITEYAREMGCSYIIALGKRGWKKLWPDFEAGKILFSKKVA